MHKMSLGGGGRFAALKKKLDSQGASNSSGLAASIGRAKYGASKMNSMAQRGKVRKKMGYK